MKLIRFLAPLSLAVVGIATFSACDATVRARTGYYSDRIGYGDPYCRMSWDYGCDYNYQGGLRIGIVFSNRHHGERWGSWHGRHWRDVAAAQSLDTAATSRPTTWQSEFNLSNAAYARIGEAFHSGLAGDTSKLAALGISKSDMLRLSRFEMPSKSSIARAANHLGVAQNDLRDFVEIYLIRLQSALASNE